MGESSGFERGSDFGFIAVSSKRDEAHAAYRLRHSDAGVPVTLIREIGSTRSLL